MKKIILILVAVAFGYGIFTEMSHKPPLNDPKKVVIYTTDTCPFSKKAKKIMDDENIAYTECNIRKSKSCRSAFNDLGATRIPTLVTNGKMTLGYNKEIVLGELAKSGS